MDSITVTTYLLQTSVSSKAIRADEMQTFCKSCVNKHRICYGIKIDQADIMCVINIVKHRILRLSGKVWDQLSSGEFLWIVTSKEWAHYSETVLEAQENHFRHGRKLVPKQPGSLSQARLKEFIDYFYKDGKYTNPLQVKCMSPTIHPISSKVVPVAQKTSPVKTQSSRKKLSKKKKDNSLVEAAKISFTHSPLSPNVLNFSKAYQFSVSPRDPLLPRESVDKQSQVKSNEPSANSINTPNSVVSALSFHGEENDPNTPSDPETEEPLDQKFTTKSPEANLSDSEKGFLSPIPVCSTEQEPLPNTKEPLSISIDFESAKKELSLKHTVDLSATESDEIKNDHDSLSPAEDSEEVIRERFGIKLYSGSSSLRTPPPPTPPQPSRKQAAPINVNSPFPSPGIAMTSDDLYSPLPQQAEEPVQVKSIKKKVSFKSGSVAEVREFNVDDEVAIGEETQDETKVGVELCKSTDSQQSLDSTPAIHISDEELEAALNDSEDPMVETSEGPAVGEEEVVEPEEEVVKPKQITLDLSSRFTEEQLSLSLSLSNDVSSQIELNEVHPEEQTDSPLPSSAREQIEIITIPTAVMIDDSIQRRGPTEDLLSPENRVTVGEPASPEEYPEDEMDYTPDYTPDSSMTGVVYHAESTHSEAEESQEHVLGEQHWVEAKGDDDEVEEEKVITPKSPVVREQPPIIQISPIEATDPYDYSPYISAASTPDLHRGLPTFFGVSIGSQANFLVEQPETPIKEYSSREESTEVTSEKSEAQEKIKPEVSSIGVQVDDFDVAPYSHPGLVSTAVNTSGSSDDSAEFLDPENQQNVSVDTREEEKSIVSVDNQMTVEDLQLKEIQRIFGENTNKRLFKAMSEPAMATDPELFDLDSSHSRIEEEDDDDEDSDEFEESEDFDNVVWVGILPPPGQIRTDPIEEIHEEEEEIDAPVRESREQSTDHTTNRLEKEKDPDVINQQTDLEPHRSSFSSVDASDAASDAAHCSPIPEEEETEEVDEEYISDILFKAKTPDHSFEDLDEYELAKQTPPVKPGFIVEVEELSNYSTGSGAEDDEDLSMTPCSPDDHDDSFSLPRTVPGGILYKRNFGNLSSNNVLDILHCGNGDYESGKPSVVQQREQEWEQAQFLAEVMGLPDDDEDSSVENEELDDYEAEKASPGRHTLQKDDLFIEKDDIWRDASSPDQSENQADESDDASSCSTLPPPPAVSTSQSNVPPPVPIVKASESIDDFSDEESEPSEAPESDQEKEMEPLEAPESDQEKEMEPSQAPELNQEEEKELDPEDKLEDDPEEDPESDVDDPKKDSGIKKPILDEVADEGGDEPSALTYRSSPVEANCESNKAERSAEVEEVLADMSDIVKEISSSIWASGVNEPPDSLTVELEVMEVLFDMVDIVVEVGAVGKLSANSAVLMEERRVLRQIKDQRVAELQSEQNRLSKLTADDLQLQDYISNLLKNQPIEDKGLDSTDNSHLLSIRSSLTASPTHLTPDTSHLKSSASSRQGTIAKRKSTESSKDEWNQAAGLQEALARQARELEAASRDKAKLEIRLEETRYLLQVFAAGLKPPSDSLPSVQSIARSQAISDIDALEETLRNISVERVNDEIRKTVPTEKNKRRHSEGAVSCFNKSGLNFNEKNLDKPKQRFKKEETNKEKQKTSKAVPLSLSTKSDDLGSQGEELFSPPPPPPVSTPDFLPREGCAGKSQQSQNTISDVDSEASITSGEFYVRKGLLRPKRREGETLPSLSSFSSVPVDTVISPPLSGGKKDFVSPGLLVSSAPVSAEKESENVSKPPPHQHHQPNNQFHYQYEQYHIHKPELFVDSSPASPLPTVISINSLTPSVAGNKVERTPVQSSTKTRKSGGIAQSSPVDSGSMEDGPQRPIAVKAKPTTHVDIVFPRIDHRPSDAREHKHLTLEEQSNQQAESDGFSSGCSAGKSFKTAAENEDYTPKDIPLFVSASPGAFDQKGVALSEPEDARQYQVERQQQFVGNKGHWRDVEIPFQQFEQQVAELQSASKRNSFPKSLSQLIMGSNIFEASDLIGCYQKSSSTPSDHLYPINPAPQPTEPTNEDHLIVHPQKTIPNPALTDPPFVIPGYDPAELDPLEAFFTYMRPFLAASVLQEKYQQHLLASTSGAPSRTWHTQNVQALLDYVTESGMVWWSIFQDYGTQEGMLVKAIKMTQVVRALKAAGWSHLANASQLDILLSKLAARRAPDKAPSGGGSKRPPALLIQPAVRSAGKKQLKTGSIVPGTSRKEAALGAVTFCHYRDVLYGVTDETLMEHRIGKKLKKVTVEMLQESFFTLLEKKEYLDLYPSLLKEAMVSRSGILMKTVYQRLDPIDTVTMEDLDLVRHVWDRNHEQIRQIFLFYAFAEYRGWFPPAPGSKRVFPPTISYDSCREMLLDFQIVPQVVDVHAFISIFRSCKLWEWIWADRVISNRLQHVQSVGGPNAKLLISNSFSVIHSHTDYMSKYENMHQHAKAKEDHHTADHRSTPGSVRSESVAKAGDMAMDSDDPLDFRSSLGNFSLTISGFIELLTRLALYERKLGKRPSVAVENLMHLMDASEGKAKLIKANRKSTSVRHFVYVNK